MLVLVMYVWVRVMYVWVRVCNTGTMVRLCGAGVV
jgi:hypothetical protein